MPSLSIQIPHDDTIETLTRELKYLETRECRSSMGEAERIVLRRIITERFRNLLKARDVFRQFTRIASKSGTDMGDMDNMDFLYS